MKCVYEMCLCKMCLLLKTSEKPFAKVSESLPLYVPRRLIFIGKIRPNWAYTRSIWAYTRSIWACTRCTWSVFSSVLWGWPTDWHISQKWAYTRSNWAYIRSKWLMWIWGILFFTRRFSRIFQNTVMVWVDPVFLRVLEHFGVLRNNLESSGMFRKTLGRF